MSNYDLDNPELYVELLSHSSRNDSCHHVHKTKSCPEPLQSALEMDDRLQKRVKSLVNAPANVIVKDPRNHPAVAARLTQKDQKEELNLHIYYTFNDTASDEYILSISKAHLSYLLDELRSAALQESPPPFQVMNYPLLQTLSWSATLKYLSNWEQRDVLNVAFGEKNVLDYRLMCSVLVGVEKLLDTLDERKGHLTKEQRADDLPLDGQHDSLLTLQECNGLLVDYMLLTKHNLLPNDHNPGDYKKLEALDMYLKVAGLTTEFARWVPKIFKLFQSTALLMGLSYSKRLSRILSGNIVFHQVPNSPPTRSHTIFTRMDLVEIMNHIISEHSPLPDDLPNDATDFIDLILLPRLAIINSTRRPHFTVHVELALALHLQQLGLASFTYPFLGLSKSSCTACVELMSLLNNSQFQSPVWLTSGTHRKIYRSWVYPNHSISEPGIKIELARRLQELLFQDFVDFSRGQMAGRLSDSSIESQGITIRQENEQFAKVVKDREAQLEQFLAEEMIRGLTPHTGSIISTLIMDACYTSHNSRLRSLKN
ncbi:hypothetical protein E1B28_002477 [Marasmius oreades]|uniref:Uncharacterized protein n=1 Tax=Marasmius oreades TaxID=181124 RepID=A0A9P7RNQ7_9AGAR|nr:uncharacterized protein E1B28_002477 [Marasmius oreades]KAG7086526.1 hypothetical protein E1B28_002477 [Marasmius oreades]